QRALGHLLRRSDGGLSDRQRRFGRDSDLLPHFSRRQDQRQHRLRLLQSRRCGRLGQARHDPLLELTRSQGAIGHRTAKGRSANSRLPPALDRTWQNSPEHPTLARMSEQGHSMGLRRRRAMIMMQDGERYARMPFRRSGRSGLKLPVISLGLWQNFGGDRPMDTQRAIIRRAFDLGITHFDLANNYGPPYGSAEE